MPWSLSWIIRKCNLHQIYPKCYIIKICVTVANKYNGLQGKKKEKLREIPSVLRSILENKILRNLHKHPQMQTERETKPSSSIAEQGCKKCQRATNGTGLT